MDTLASVTRIAPNGFVSARPVTAGRTAKRYAANTTPEQSEIAKRRIEGQHTSTTPLRRKQNMRTILIALALIIATGCATKSDPRQNRAVQFASWMEPKSHCQPLTTSATGSGADTALCEIRGQNHWCTAPAETAPSCTPYGAPPQQPPTPTSTGSGSGK